jgi:hypothetical protein
MQQRLKDAAVKLLNNGTVDRVLGWKTGEFFYDLTPAAFTTAATDFSLIGLVERIAHSLFHCHNLRIFALFCT